MKYKLPVGTNIRRYSSYYVKRTEEFTTTKEVVYTKTELGDAHGLDIDYRTYYKIRIPLKDGFDMIQVFRDAFDEI